MGEVRLLSPALPASVILAGALLFPGTNWWLPTVAAVCVMPMDLAPVLLRDERVPLRVRAALNIEGGFDDGLISLVVVLCVANQLPADGDGFTTSS
ncbi:MULTISPECIES: hypothetical protein [unclassified Streptomyces]|uniref:hypothetical protein n=1 Tax=unclassified Streptomyces TaxID=2593676 RepID=UPI00165681C6|nr:hypothetical protein [Streptomyces sp. CB02980]MCB8901484.1 hypothetical protein [Streptomyces sp. CB02980]